MKPSKVKKIFMDELKRISSLKKDFIIDPEKNFSRNRIFTFEKIIWSVLSFEGKSLPNELLNLFNNKLETPSVSAFVQQRNKVKPEAFKSLFDSFTKVLINSFKEDFHIFAVDGSDIQIYTNPFDSKTYHPKKEEYRGFNLLHINALYDLNHNLYTDIVIQNGRERNEHIALQEMIDRSDISKALIIADRGYESYNNLAHIQEKGWNFLFRVKDGKTGIKAGITIPKEDIFDEHISLMLTRKQTNEVKKLCGESSQCKYIAHTTPLDYLPSNSKKSDPIIFYELKFRIIRFKLSDNTYETILTNLDENKYPIEKIKELYACRWGIETSFRDLKYTLGMNRFHSKKVMCIHQEIYSQMIMYNFIEMITSHVTINKEKKKYKYKTNFSIAAHICKKYLKGKTTSLDLETIIAKNLIPIRENRHYKRKHNNKSYQCFYYRIS